MTKEEFKQLEEKADKLIADEIVEIDGLKISMEGARRGSYNKRCRLCDINCHYNKKIRALCNIIKNSYHHGCYFKLHYDAI